MKQELIDVILEELKLALEVYMRTFEKVRTWVGKKDFSEYEVDIIEAFVSRFSRLSDIFFSRGLRLLERLKLEETGSIKDRLNHAEKWGIVDDVRSFVFVRELRNEIVHEYNPLALISIFPEVVRVSPLLIAAVKRLITSIEKERMER